MKKLVFVALTMLLLLMTVSFSAHAEDDIQLCYTLTSDISAALSISGGTATCSGTISMRSGSSASMTMKLQQKVDNKWTTIATWTTSGKAPTVSLSKTKSVSKGYSYRVYVSGTVKMMLNRQKRLAKQARLKVTNLTKQCELLVP